MRGRDPFARAEPGFSLPVLERLAPPPPPDLIAGLIERHSGPGDVVLDLHGRGGWVARAAIDRQRRGVSIETGPLTRLLAELVLRPPDLRHLDAAFQALSASPRGETSLRLAVGELFASRCATCGRALLLDDVAWDAPPEAAPGTGAEAATESADAPARKLYRCTVCRDQQRGGEQRQAPLDDDDRKRAGPRAEAVAVRHRLADRFPISDGGAALVEDLLDLHTDRQLLGLAWILERIESDLRAEPVEAALRLGLLHAIGPASRLAGPTGRPAALRVADGRVRRPTGPWRERNPWLAFEEGFRLVRAFVQRLEATGLGPIQARLGTDIRSLGEGAATAVLHGGGPATLRALQVEARDLARRPVRPRLSLVLGQAPVQPAHDRLALAFQATGWVLGRDAAASLPIEPLLGSPLRAPWGWQAAAMRRSLEAIEPLLERHGRAVLLLESGGAEALTAAALGGAGAGYRVVEARLGEADRDHGGVVELLPPGAPLPPGPRTRANVPLGPVSDGAGDPELVPGRGLFAPPERYDARPFSAADAARTVTESAVEALRARGEPARMERLLGEILIGLERAGQLRRLVAAPSGSATPESVVPEAEPGHVARPAEPPEPARGADGTRRPDVAGTGPLRGSAAAPPGSGTSRIRGHGAAPAPTPDQVERLVALIRDELARPNQRRLVEIEPGRWWLGDREDRAAAAAPLADRVEWAVYSLLSTAGPLSESVFFERIAGLFGGPDLPDETLVRSCLQSYRSRASTPERLVTGEDLLRRSEDHAELLALLVDGGHRLGLQVWLGLREQGRRVDGVPLGDLLDDREQSAHLPGIVRAPVDEVEAVDCIWYVRGRLTFLFEVEWTAMLGEPVLRRHARIPQEEHIARFLVIPPERTELVRHKLERSPVLRAALEEGNWHVLKWNHLRTFLAAEEPDLADLEPLLGLDPTVERSGEQLPLFSPER